MECQHLKVYSPIVKASCPPIHSWICFHCGISGTEEVPSHAHSYDDVVKKFAKPKDPAEAYADKIAGELPNSGRIAFYERRGSLILAFRSGQDHQREVDAKIVESPPGAPQSYKDIADAVRKGDQP